MEEPVPSRIAVMTALDETVRKLKLWAPEALKQMGGKKDEVMELQKAMNHDTLMYIPYIKAILKDHAKRIELKDVAFFRSLMPVNYQVYAPTQEIVEKGFLYLRVFESLLKDLEG
jgi:hypothetical protein